MRNCVRACVAASLGGLMACAATEPAPVPTAGAAELRLMVKLELPSGDTQAIVNKVSAAAGVSARYVSAASPQWHALVLVCANAAACESAWLRLQSRPPPGIEALQRDERRRAHSPS